MVDSLNPAIMATWCHELDTTGHSGAHRLRTLDDLGTLGRMTTGIASSKARENRLRRTAERRGLRLVKSRRRDPRALDYGSWYITDASTSGLLTSEHGIDLDQVEAWLNEDTTQCSRA
jgi:hypothetical protein